MKTFIICDFYLQILFLISGIVSAFTCESYFQGIPFYFIVGFPQLISYIIKLFLDVERSSISFIYGFFIIPIWICLTLNMFFGEYSHELNNILMIVPFYGLFYSPILAILYIIYCYKLYKY